MLNFLQNDIPTYFISSKESSKNKETLILLPNYPSSSYLLLDG